MDSLARDERETRERERYVRSGERGEILFRIGKRKRAT